MLFSLLNFRENGNLRGKSLFASLRRHLERKPLVKKNGSLQNWLCLGFVWALFGLCLGVARHGPTSGGRMYILLPFYSLPVSLRALPFSSQ